VILHISTSLGIPTNIPRFASRTTILSNRRASILDTSFKQHAKEYIDSDRVYIINNPNSFRNKFLKRNKKVTIVTASYNSENFIKQTMDSVINQTIGMHNIEHIIVDDCSTDNSPEIIKEYALQYNNICFVSLKENSGSPGLPRNIGIELATGKYITFLDADDWLAPDGIEALYNILEETNDDYVVGKTIKVETKEQSIVGEFASIMERRSISPFDVPHFFHHMGPPSKMMKLSLLKEHDIRFPEMKFAEDKLFFCDVFFHVNRVSTTTKPIYYVNRTDDNPSSLTRVTNVLDKRRSDLNVINYIKVKKLSIEKEKAALTRIYETDIVKTFDSWLFVKSESKEDFIEILEQAIETTKNLRYDFRKGFKTPFYRAAIDLFLEGRKDDFIKLFEWSKRDKNKKYVIQDSFPYYEVPFLEDKYRFIRIPMLAKALDSYVVNNRYVQTFEIYGDYIDNINTVLIRDRKRFDNEVHCDFHISGNFGQLQVNYKDLDKLKNSLFTVFIRYNDYQLINIKRILKTQVTHGKRNVEFYTSLANNLSLSIKS